MAVSARVMEVSVGGREEAIEALHAATALYTSRTVVEDLLDRIGWPDACGRLLDPSAGDGSFVEAALSRLETSEGDMAALSRVRGVELHPVAVEAARARVAALLVGRGWGVREARVAAATVVLHGDFLADAAPEGEFSFIAGNPPYIRFGHLPDYFKYLYAASVEAFARGDVMHAFLDRCVAMMPDDGVVALVTSDRWLMNQTAAELRRRMGERAGIAHLARLDAQTSFYRPKERRKGTPPRIHPVEVVLRRPGAGTAPLGAAPVSPDGTTCDGEPGGVLADVATVRLAPWLGPKGIFVVKADAVGDLPRECLVPAVDHADIDAETGTLRAPRRYAIRTERGAEPQGAVRAHLLSQIERMPKRGRLGRWWMPPEAITLPLDRPALLVPRIAKTLRVVRIEAGILPINHNLYVVSDDKGMGLDDLAAHLLSDETQAWVVRNAPRIDDGYLDIRAGLIRRIPVGR